MADTIESLAARLSECERVIGALRAALGGGRNASADGAGNAASDRELDDKFGEGATCKFNPRDWKGESIKNKKMSECHPDALEVYAESCEWFANKNDAAKAVTTKGKPKGDYDRLDARRARGWARRLRSGWVPPAKPAFDPNAGGFEAPDGGFGGGGAAFDHSGDFDAPAGGFETGGGFDGTGSEDEIPFVSASDPTPRHLRRRTRWERF